MLRIASALVLGLIATVPTTVYSAEIFRGSGNAANATFFTFEECTPPLPGGSIFRNVAVSAQENVVHNAPGGPALSSVAQVVIIEFDTCGGPFVTLLFGFAPDQDFRMSEGLTSASLNGTVEVCNQFDPFECFDVTIDLDWAGTGEASRGINNTHIIGPFQIFTKFRGLIRDAQAIGSVSDGITNFTPTPSTFGSLQSADSMELRF